jgi:hypothetical protein
LGNWRKFGDRIVIGLGADVLIDCHRRDWGQQQRVAVRCRLLHRPHPHAAIGAGAILDDHRTVERDAHLVGDQPRHGVAGAASGEWKNDADRPLADLGAKLPGAEAERDECGDGHPA